MQPVSNFEAAGNRGTYRPTGTMSAGQLADLITAALHRARHDRLSEILINISAVQGFESPGPAFRRWAVLRWAQVVGTGLRIALIARPELVCPKKTGLLVAAEEGLRANIFTTEPEAAAWLDTPPQPGPNSPVRQSARS